jgi:hypothetical protein
MNNMDLTPAMGQPMPWYQVWMQVVTHPSRDSFRRILADPTARPARAFIWVAILGAIFGVTQAILTQVFGTTLYGNLGNLRLATTMICIVIAAPVVSVIGLALSAAILHGIALLLKGEGKYNDLLYCLGAVQAPVSIVSFLISFITTALTSASIRFGAGASGSLVSLCILPFSLALGAYSIVLEVLAVDTVEKFGTGKAVLTVLVPVILAIMLGVCVALVLGIAVARQFQQ